MFEIVERDDLREKVHRFSISAAHVAKKASPGQFVILIVDEKGERVPFTISGWDKDAGTVDFVFIVVGSTTQKLAALNEGDSLAHFIGPLGKTAEIEEFGHVVCMCSGYGIGGMLPIIRALKEKGNRITTILQAPDEASLFYREEHADLADDLVLGVGVAGGDGSAGATAIAPLHRLLGGHKYDPIHRVIVMGSICMMRLICRATRPQGIKTMVHMAPVMVDGTGMCGACRFLTEGGTRFACVHGPEYDGHLVKGWEVLMARRCTYADGSVKQAGFVCRSCAQW